MTENTFVFIGGLHKSGTSIMHRCLREHPQISAFRNTAAAEDEGQYLQSVFPPEGYYGRAGAFGMNPDAHITEESALVSTENQRRLLGDWSKHWDMGVPILVEKTPANLLRARALQALFPSARFVMLKRHPIAVSYATMVWNQRVSLDMLLEHWLTCYDILDADALFLSHLLVVSYEDFVADTQHTLDRVYGFIGVSSHQNRLEVKDFNPKYFTKWQRERRMRRSLFDRYEVRLNSHGRD